MKIIVWLWNPGEQYRETRHNLGFILLDKFQGEEWFSDWKYESKFMADISSWMINWEKVILVKPLTFMNLSGESLRKICNFYKLWTEDFRVIYDDIAMDFGKIRLRDKWSAGWHNGVKNIIQHFWDTWSRIKVWVWKDERYETSDWVLSKFTQEELIDIDTEIYSAVSQELKKN